ncbi:hypothetical protein H9L19_01760 [Weissella diestrammenae]|uniref:ImmA/IrrE family metallo-endopeptidase n=1 Tax=Weissella diestrammenae TaxID=1162633 RepID=A0A7G9T6A1_9LACO|nr:hypothetical protein [Weissella diestrammenae]MCM0583328.1 hypothetical protein [Weissella diestrammenae]QNN75626.1 hypothetical protein H9L19_01760 [Weissella diestrammenae]
MHSTAYEDLLIRIENDLTRTGLNPVISDTVPLHAETELDGVTFIKGENVFIFIDKDLDLFSKAKTLVEEYFHAISDIGNHLDYDSIRAHNDEVEARESVITYMTDEKQIMTLARRYADQQFGAWVLVEELGYDPNFANETINYYQTRGVIPF